MKTLIIVYSYHHNNTLKVAKAMAEILDAEIKTPYEAKEKALGQYDLIGFGAGIDSGMHYKELLDFAASLEQNTEAINCFIFSTSAVQINDKVTKDHSKLRNILCSKNYNILGEFSCKGFNTNKFLKYFGGMNKNRPNAEDIANAKMFAQQLMHKSK